MMFVKVVLTYKPQPFWHLLKKAVMLNRIVCLVKEMLRESFGMEK